METKTHNSYSDVRLHAFSFSVLSVFLLGCDIVAAFCYDTDKNSSCRKSFSPGERGGTPSCSFLTSLPLISTSNEDHHHLLLLLLLLLLLSALFLVPKCPTLLKPTTTTTSHTLTLSSSIILYFFLPNFFPGIVYHTDIMVVVDSPLVEPEYVLSRDTWAKRDEGCEDVTLLSLRKVGLDPRNTRSR
ncbi:hypothetical protein MLD38_018325 [Melastoma candidum]|uniref:Uncharacterized protein n=1 Tax=Melastoma candidum TaxID=119954 RepID=A0ACB9QWY9_9MYRT|nr:hypothetical protein MLD38_018325 [Melastoma candidum]